MRPNLSIDTFTAVLAALGTTTLLAASACGGAQPQPVNATEVKPAAAAPANGMASCSAKGCGGKADTAAASAGTPATPATTETSAAAAAPASASAPAAAPAAV